MKSGTNSPKRHEVDLVVAVSEDTVGRQHLGPDVVALAVAGRDAVVVPEEQVHGGATCESAQSVDEIGRLVVEAGDRRLGPYEETCSPVHGPFSQGHVLLDIRIGKPRIPLDVLRDICLDEAEADPAALSDGLREQATTVPIDDRQEQNKADQDTPAFAVRFFRKHIGEGRRGRPRAGRKRRRRRRSERSAGTEDWSPGCTPADTRQTEASYDFGRARGRPR